MVECEAYNDVMFEDVAECILVIEDCLVELEPFGSFPVGDVRRPDYDDLVLIGGEI